LAACAVDPLIGEGALVARKSIEARRLARQVVCWNAGRGGAAWLSVTALATGSKPASRRD